MSLELQAVRHPVAAMRFLRQHDPRRRAPSALVLEEDEQPPFPLIHNATEMVRNLQKYDMTFAGHAGQMLGFIHREWGKQPDIKGKIGRTAQIVFEESATFYRELDLGHRASNALFKELEYHEDQQVQVFGTEMVLARNNPLMNDHNALGHLKRFGEWLNEWILNIPELRHLETVAAVPHMLHLAYQMHDMHQILMMAHNLDTKANNKGEETGEKKERDVKKMHDMAAAAMTLILSPTYARAAHISEEKAWSISKGTAVMIDRHSDIAHYLDSFRGKKKAYKGSGSERRPLEIEELIEGYMGKNNRLDRFSMSPSDFFRILKHENDRLKISDPNDPFDFGLDPQMQRAFLPRIIALMNDHAPLFDDITETQREDFIMASQAFLGADILDMITPIPTSAARKGLNQVSANRMLHRVDMPPAESIDEIFHGDGTGSSDLVRDFYERLRQAEAFRGSPILKNPYIKRLFEYNAIMGVHYYADFVKHLLRGDIDYLNTIFYDRIDQLMPKLLKEADINAKDAQLIMNELSGISDPVERQGRLQVILDETNPTVGETFAYMLDSLDGELGILKLNILCKPDKPGGPKKEYADRPVLPIYDEHIIAGVDQVRDAVLEKLYREYTIPPNKQEEYREMATRGEFTQHLPYKAPDSIRKHNDQRMGPRTIRVYPRPEVEGELVPVIAD